MKRILTVQDLSCVGKCSLTVALPIISAIGVEAAVLPTALLSTHTAFSKYTFCDLTQEMEPIEEVFSALGFDFDAIYTGYLGSVRQIHAAERLIDRFKDKKTMVLIDPVLGDFGKLYAGFDQAYADRMLAFCQKADLIMPNLTEAVSMLKMPYRESYDEAYIKEILLRLAEKGIRRIALTGVSLETDQIGFYLYDAVKNRFTLYQNPKLPIVCHGTGDIFASVVTGAMMRGYAAAEALRLAADFVSRCIQCTIDDPHPRLYGVNFEEALPHLIRAIEK